MFGLMFVSPLWFFVATAPIWAYFLYKIEIFAIDKFTKNETVALWSKDVLKRWLVTGSLLMSGGFWTIVAVLELASRGVI